MDYQRNKVTFSHIHTDFVGNLSRVRDVYENQWHVSVWYLLTFDDMEFWFMYNYGKDPFPISSVIVRKVTLLSRFVRTLSPLKVLLPYFCYKWEKVSMFLCHPIRVTSWEKMKLIIYPRGWKQGEYVYMLFNHISVLTFSRNSLCVFLYSIQLQKTMLKNIKIRWTCLQ